MIPATMSLQHRYPEIRAPLFIITGGDDQVVDAGRHSMRLHRAVPGSEILVVPGLGHMLHHLAPDLVVEAVDRVVHRAARARLAASKDETVEARWP
jgi:pimeloyl-ACP methyl ester carboxylesterase